MKAMIPMLCLVVLPAWLVVTGRPEMIAPPRREGRPEEAPRIAGAVEPEAG